MRPVARVVPARSLVVVCMVVTAIVAGCHRADASATTAGAGSTATPTASATGARLVAPEPLRHVTRVEAMGTLKPRHQAHLAFAIPGTLAKILVKRGQSVKQGAPLLLLDAAAIRAQLAQAEAGIAAARAQVVLAQDALARLESIQRDDGGVTESQLVQARGQIAVAKAQLAGAEAQRDQAKVTADRHTLRAPFEAVVTRIPDGIGVAVAAGAPLVTVESVRLLVLDTSLTQAEAALVRVGARVEVSVPATGARTDDGVLSVIVPTVDASTNRVPVEISVPNADGRFLPNASARARVAAGAPRSAYRVPAAAVLQKDGAYALWIAATDGRARAVPVRVLAQDGDAAVVEPDPAPLPAGARVVALPPVGLVEGQAIAETAPR